MIVYLSTYNNTNIKRKLTRCQNLVYNFFKNQPTWWVKMLVKISFIITLFLTLPIKVIPMPIYFLIMMVIQVIFIIPWTMYNRHNPYHCHLCTYKPKFPNPCAIWPHFLGWVTKIEQGWGKFFKEKGNWNLVFHMEFGNGPKVPWDTWFVWAIGEHGNPCLFWKL